METLNITSISPYSTRFTKTSLFSTNSISSFPQHSNYFTKTKTILKSNKKTLILSKSSEETEVTVTEEDWVKSLPDKKKPLYSHSLLGIEAWLKQLGFFQSNEDRAVWFIEKNDWHAKVSLDVTDLFIRYLKSGPGNLDKDVERRFSYALSREDIENAILGGP